MSTNAMPSGRGRLPGMGGASAPPTTTPAPDAPATTKAEPVTPDSRPSVRRPRTSSPGPHAAEALLPPTRSTAAVIDGPYAGETKIQVNPRIYTSIWNHYEDLVDELPRAQRRGALTALVNAVLAQHAPQTAAEALAAIDELRRAEMRSRPTSS